MRCENCGAIFAAAIIFPYGRSQLHHREAGRKTLLLRRTPKSANPEYMTTTSKTPPNEGLAALPGSAAHAVRWSLPSVGLFEKYTKWHWTFDGATTACGRLVRLIGGGDRLLPEIDDRQEIVTCKRCKQNTKISPSTSRKESRMTDYELLGNATLFLYFVVAAKFLYDFLKKVWRTK